MGAGRTAQQRHWWMPTRRAGRRRGVLAAALVAGLIGALVTTTPAQAAPFTAGAPTIYIAQGDPTTLYAGTQSAGNLNLTAVGSAGIVYNSIAYHVPSNYLYGISGTTLVRIHSNGSTENIATLPVGSEVGAFAYPENPNLYYYRNGTTLYWYQVGTGSTGSRAMSAAFSASDFTYANGYFWGLLGQTMYRMSRSTGVVTTHTVAGLDLSRFSGGTTFGGAWTYGNGNLGFTNNSGGTVQLRVVNPTAASPTFQVVAYMAGPATSNNDAAASPGQPVDLGITKAVDLSQARVGDVLTYTLTVSNESAADSSGYVINDTLPAGLAVVTSGGSPVLPAGCALSGQTVTCSGGGLLAGADRTIQFDVQVVTPAVRGDVLVNTATVLGNEEDLVTSNNSASAQTEIIESGIALVKTATYDDANDNGNPDLGETVNWEFVVTNTGDVELTGVVVVDPTVSGITPATPQTIAAGASVTFAASRGITQADIDDGLVTNTATATGVDTWGETITSAPSTANIPIRAFPGLEAIKSGTLDDVNANGVADAGETIDYSVAVTNTGNVTLTDVSVTDVLLPLAPASVAVLAPGASTTFTGTYTVTAADVTAGSVVNSATAEGTTPDGSTTTTPPTSVEIETPVYGITLVKSSDRQDPAYLAALDDPIEYRFVVTNTGNVTLENVTIADDRVAGTTPASATIAPGEQQIFIANYTVTQADIDLGGAIVNTATATGTPIGGPPQTSDEATVSVPLAAQEPTLGLLKEAVLDDTNANGGADVGETIAYSLLVTNTGNVTLTGVTGADPMLTGLDTTPVTLLPGEQHRFTADPYVVTQADVDAGQIVNTATASGTDPNDQPVASAPSSTTTPAAAGAPVLHAVKSAAHDDANGNGVADVGESIQYSVRVWNYGDVTATGVSIDDPKAGAFAPADADIAPGASQVFTAAADYIVTQADVDSGSVDNVATASGGNPQDPDGPEVTSPPTSTSTDAPAPALAIEKFAVLDDRNGNGLADVGELIAYTFVVTNGGNVRVDGISVDDPRVSGLTPAGFSLGAGQSRTVTADPYTVTHADVIAGVVSNTATATGTPDGDDTPITTDPSTREIDTVAAAASFTIDKTGVLDDKNGNALADLDERVQYSFLIVNTGTLTITDITVSDPKVTGITPNPVTLEPGEQATLTADPYVVTQADIDAGAVLNTVTATGTPPVGPPIEEEDQHEVPGPDAAPGLVATKTGAHDDVNGNGVADEGETITYTIEVQNTGTVTLTDVAPSDPMISTFTPASVATLAPGATASFVSDAYVVTAADVTAGTVRNTATAVGTPPDDVPIESPPTTEEIPTYDPGLLLEKRAALQDTNGNGLADLGESILYTFRVENTGNVTVTGVTIDDPRVSGVEPASADLDPDDVVTFRADPYVVTEGDILAGVLSNTAVATGVPDGGTPFQSNEDTVTTPPAPPAPGLSVVKLADLQDANGNDHADAGERILFSFEVTNIGNVTMRDVSVDDDMVTGLDPASFDLAPGERVVVEADPYVVTEADVRAGRVLNVASASGVDPFDELTTSALAEAAVPTTPAMARTGLPIAPVLIPGLVLVGGGLLLLIARSAGWIGRGRHAASRR